jgi:ribose transport system ATP-binding protein
MSVLATKSKSKSIAVQPPAIQLKGVVKSFGSNRVLQGVDFEVRHGEVHALAGGNGAGKSTLMKILQGVYTLDEGAIEVEGRPVRFRTSNDARAHGIGMIFQEFSLVPTLNVARNVFLGHEPRMAAGFLDDGESQRRARAIFEQIGVDIDPRARVADLSPGYRQLTEIAKALSREARILIMDEPTASLAKAEVQGLFDIIRTLTRQGIAVIYISHRMEEVFEIADRITVLRDGRRVITEPVANLTLPKLIEYMVGGRMEHSLVWQPREVKRSGTPLLEVRNLAAGPRVRGVTFELYPGEILGIAGLMGSGRSETARALFGADPIDSGEVLMHGRPVHVKSPSESIKTRLALVPEDRRTQGLVLQHSVRDNLLLPILSQLKRWGFIQDQRGDEIVNFYVDQLKIKTDSIRKQVSLLSGGNQQKVAIAKWLATKPEVLILDEPTVGVDIATKVEIMERIRELADGGTGIIVISSEFPELLAVSDRIVVLRGGKVYRTLDRAELEKQVTGGDDVRIGVAEEVLNRIVQGESQIVGTGPHGETATPASEVELSEDEIDRIKAMNATAAIVFHYTTDWSRAQLEGIQTQFARMGVQVIAVTDAGFRAEKQIEDVEAILTRKPDVIVAIPVEQTAMAAVFKKAAASGIKIVFMDNVPDGMEPGSNYISVVSADNFGLGEASAHLLGEKLDSTAKVGVIFHAADFFVTNQRYEAFKETLSKHYPGIQVVSEEGVGGPDFRHEAEQAAASILNKHSDVKGIWAVWDDLAEGVVAAVHAANRRDLMVVTVDYGEGVATLLARGDVVAGVIAQRPYDQGVTEAILGGYGLLGKPAPPYVAVPPLTVTKETAMGAWRTVYRRDPPRTLATSDI